MNTLSTLGQQYEILSLQGIQEEYDITFTGAGGAGAIGTITLFTVTGLVKVRAIAYCETTPVGAGTIELGTTINTAGLITQIADATNLATGEIWHDATPDASVELVTGTTSYPEKFVSQDIKLKIASAAITAGRIRFVIQWAPVTKGSSVVSTLGNQISASPSLSPSASTSASLSPSASASRSLSPSASVSPSSSVSPSASASSSISASLSPSSSASASVSASLSPSASSSASRSPSSSSSLSLSPSSSSSPSLSPSASTSPSASVSASLSPSPL